jgi:hypothetical protein
MDCLLLPYGSRPRRHADRASGSRSPCAAVPGSPQPPHRPRPHASRHPRGAPPKVGQQHVHTVVALITRLLPSTPGGPSGLAHGRARVTPESRKSAAHRVIGHRCQPRHDPSVGSHTRSTAHRNRLPARPSSANRQAACGRVVRRLWQRGMEMVRLLGSSKEGPCARWPIIESRSDDKRDTAPPPSDRSLDTAERLTGSTGEPAGPENPPRGRPHPGKQPPRRTRVGSLWGGMILCAVVLVVLLAFAVQNGSPVGISFFIWEFTLPTGWRCSWLRSPDSSSWRSGAAAHGAAARVARRPTDR